MILGIDLRDTRVSAIAADDGGVVVERSSAGGNGRGAVHEALLSLMHHAPSCIGAAVDVLDDPAAADRLTGAGDVASLGGLRVVQRGSAVALAEQWSGAARGSRHVVALTAEDRVHAGIVLDGMLFEGATGRAGAAGWLALNPADREDYRTLGCFESEAGAGGIVRRFVWRLKAGDMSPAADAVAGDFAAITVDSVLDAARGGDGVALSVVRDTTKYLGMAIGNVVALLDPEIVVLGGLYARAADLFVDGSRADLSRRMSSRAGGVRIVAGALGDEAPAIGAARAAMLSS